MAIVRKTMTYSQVRAETHTTRTYILKTLMNQPTIADLWHDDSDLVLVTLKTGEKVMIYLVDLGISAHEVEKTLHENNQKGVFSLFMFWADMLLPNDGKQFIPDPWMRGLLNLYSDKLYGYDVSQSEVFIFPVYFQPQPLYPERRIRWGKTVRLADLRPALIQQGGTVFRLAVFDPAHHHTPKNGAASTPRHLPPTHLHTFYLLLELPLDATPEDIRRAYRERARLFHPDLNPAAEATAKMQDLNTAYTQIMLQFGED